MLDLKRKDHKIPQALMNIHLGPDGITTIDKKTGYIKTRFSVKNFGYEIDADKHFDMLGNVQALDDLVSEVENLISETNIVDKHTIIRIFCMQRILRSDRFNSEVFDEIRKISHAHPSRNFVEDFVKEYTEVDWIESQSAIEYVVAQYHAHVSSIMKDFVCFEIIEAGRPSFILGDCFGVIMNDCIYCTCTPTKIAILSKKPIESKIDSHQINAKIYERAERFVVYDPRVFM